MSSQTHDKSQRRHSRIHPPHRSPPLVSTRPANSLRAVNSHFLRDGIHPHPRSGDSLTCFTANPSQLTLSRS
ncbi:hypothetical protein AAFF_G00255840, partial [Aldrovandia affinis]